MSYNTILSVVNEHTASTVIVRYAISLAMASKARLVLYAAHYAGGNETMLRRTELHMDYLVAAASKHEIPVTRITEEGDIGKLLAKRVQAENADLVCYSLLPDERYGANLRRHTVHHLLRTIRTDLAIMRAITMAKPHPRNILVPLGRDVSGRDRRLKLITELAKSFDSQVTLFHLLKEHDAARMPGDITWFRNQLQEQNVTVQERISRGDVGRAITVEALTRHNDLVVLGASERGALQRVLFGNPAGDIMHRPPCNAILFRAGH